MRTNSRIRKRKQAIPSIAVSDTSKFQDAGSGQILTKTPDYSSMKNEIEKIKNPVSFDGLKSFYGMT